MRFKSKLGNMALEDFKDDEVKDKANPTAGVDEPEPDAVETETPDTTADTSTDTAGAAAAADASTTDTSAAATDAGAADAGATDATVTEEPDATATGDTQTDAQADPADAAAASTVDATLTEADAVTDPETDVVEEDPEAAEVEAEMTEVDETKDKEDELTEDVEKLSIASESLENAVAALECSIERGGLDYAGSLLARNNVNTVTQFLNVRNLRIPALEDAETPSTKIEAAGNLKDTVVAFIKRIIDSIKSAAARFGAWVVDTYKRLTNVYSALEARANKLAEKVKTSEMKTGAIDNAKLATALSLGGQPVQALQQYIDSLARFAMYMNSPGTYDKYLTAVSLCEEMVRDPSKEEQIRGDISKKLAEWGSEMEKYATNNAKEMQGAPSKADTGTQGFTVKVLGNQVITVTLPATADGIGSMSSAVAASNEPAGTGSVDALDQAKASAICASVAKLAKQVRESSEGNRGGVKELTAEIKKRSDTIVGMMTALQSKTAEGDEASMIRKVTLYVSKFLASAPKLPVHAVNRTLPHDLTTALNYVAASIGGAASEGNTKQIAEGKISIPA